MKKYRRIDDNKYLGLEEYYSGKISFKISRARNIEIDIRDLLKSKTMNKKECKPVAINLFAYKYLTEEYKLI